MGGASRTHRTEYTSTTSLHRQDSGGSPPPSFTDGRLNDSSSSSFSQSSASRQPQHGSPQMRSNQTATTKSTTSNVSFTSPRDSSTPHTTTRHTSTTYTYPPRTSSQFKDSFHSERVNQTAHTSRGVGPDEVMPEQSPSDSQQRRPLSTSFTRTSTTTTTTTRGRDHRGDGASPGSRRHGGTHPQHPGAGASAYPSSGAAYHQPPSLSLHGLGDFDTLETRLQKALDSPTLQVCVHAIQSFAIIAMVMHL